MSPRHHDWNMILADAGDEPLAPSAMKYLDTTLDAQTTREQYREDIRFSISFYGHSEGTQQALRSVTDLAIMNLIVTHLGSSLKDHHLSNLGLEHTSGDIRRYLLIAHMERSVTRRNTAPRLNSLTDSKDPLLLDYPISTNAGLAAQHGVIQFMLRLWEHKNHILIEEVIGAKPPVGWFNDPTLLKYVLDHPGQAERVADIMNERNATDLNLIDSILTSSTPAVAQGLL